MRKYISYICLLFVAVIIFFSIVLKDNSKQNKYIYYYNSYNITTLINEESYLNVNLFVNNSKSYFVDKGQVSYCFLKNEENIIDLKLIDIYKTNEIVNYLDEDYTKFNYKFQLIFDTSDEMSWVLNNVILFIEYNNNKEYNINIGDLTINKITKNKEIISLTNIKPLTSVIKNNTYLTGIIIGIRKVVDDSMILNKIRILDGNIFIGNKVYTIDCMPNTNSFNDVANFSYDSLVKGNDEVNIKLTKEHTYIFIPLFYNKIIATSEFPIEFKILINGKEEIFTLSDYIFYEPTNYIVNDSNLIIKNIE